MSSKQKAKKLKRLSKDEFKQEILAMEKAKPVVLDEDQFHDWLEHTVLARFGRGEKSLEEVKEVLERAASQKSGEVNKKDLNLAINALEQAIIAFQYGVLKFNIMYRPAIDGKEVQAALLWNRPDIGKRQVKKI